MKKTPLVLATLFIAAALLVVAGCSSGQNQTQSGSASSAAAQMRAFEALPTSSGENIVSDGEHICFYYENHAPSIATGAIGLYCADPDLKTATHIYFDNDCSPLCLANGKLYCNGDLGISVVNLASNDISLVSGTNGVARPFGLVETGGSGSGTSPSLLYNDGVNNLHLEQLTDDGSSVSSEPLAAIDDSVNYAQAGDGVIYFVQYKSGDDRLSSLALNDGTKGPMTVIESAIASQYAFAVIGSDVYYLVPEAGTDDDADNFATYELMHSDAAGNTASTGVTGVVNTHIYAYDGCVFYTAQIEGTDANGETADVGRPAYYDPETGTAFVIDRATYEGMDLSVLGVSGGYLYLENFIGMAEPDTVEERILFDKLDGSGELIDADALTAAAKTTEQASTWNDAEKDQQAENARKTQEESIANEPYGPGTSELYLKADSDRSACYRLVRRDGTVEFQVLLEPGESVTKTFPCGRYTLKIAQGTEWISDEEAFGPEGEYDTTDLFNFEDGGSYKIGTSQGASIRNDSQKGFTS